MPAGSEITAFLEDLFENLGAIETAILRLESGENPPVYLNEIFRAAHTIKGNAAMMNLTNLVALGHSLETTLQECIAGKLRVDRNALRLFGECRAGMTSIGDALRDGRDPSEIGIRDTTDRLQVLLLEDTPETGDAQDDTIGTYEVRLHIARAELVPAVRAFLVETKLAELGTITHKEPGDEKLESPEFLASARALRYVVESTQNAAEIRANLNIDLIEDVSVSPVARTAAEIPGSQVRAADFTAETQSIGADTVRLNVGVLDRLLNLTGELVIANGALTQLAEELGHFDAGRNYALGLTEKNREIHRIASEIQNVVMQSRMLPMENVFSRFRRFVTDYAEKTGKAIRLELSGEKTELDKRVIDEMVKPLTHLIRNALDHGLEPRDERIAAGKPPEGTLRITAAQAGSSILITVEDDGRGMNLEKILARALEKNLVTEAQAGRLTPDEIRNFIFLPGFSTKEAADDVSGRGFGMDIVRDSIERLSGDLNITSNEGRGTRMTVKLPLTLAIQTTLTFRIRRDIFALPLNVIEETLRIRSGSVLEVDGREIIHSRDSVLPFLRLDRVLGYPENAAPVQNEDEYEYAIVADLHGYRIAVGVDEFVKKQDLVVKSLNTHYRHIPGLAGAAMLGNDEIVFILDLAEVVELYRNQDSILTDVDMSRKRDKKQADSTPNEKDPFAPEAPAPAIENAPVLTVLDTGNRELVRQWILQSNKAAVNGIQMLTGNATISVKKSKGSRFKAAKIQNAMEKILQRADSIYLIHLPMLPAAGAIDLILDRQAAVRMAGLLFTAAGLKQSGEFDPGPLMEITNILGSAYTNTLTFLTGLSVEPATPDFLDTTEAIKTLIESRKQMPGGEILIVENQFHIEDEDIEVDLVIYLNG